MSVVSMGTKTFVMAGVGAEDQNGNGVVDIMSNVVGSRVFVKEDCLPIVNLVGVDSIVAYKDKLFLALASGQLQGTHYFGGVYIYRYYMY